MGALSEGVAQLHFLRPGWLWALFGLPLLAWAWQRRQQRDSVWRGAVDPHLLPHLLDARHVGGNLRGLLSALLAAVLAVLALAGPAWRQGEQPLLQVRAPLVVALDLSTATLANDLPPSRLLQARAKIRAVLAARAGGQVALVAYAGDAFTVAPLTDDAANVALFLDALAPDVMPVDGSDAARAIRRGADLLDRAGFQRGRLLLLTDHADGEAIAAAAAVAAAGVQVSALGVGTPQGATYRKGDGGLAQARLDAASLHALARAGGGRYHPLTADVRDLAALDVLDAGLATAEASARGETARVWRDDGYWLLLPLLLLGALAFRRGALVAAVLAVACWPTLPAQAAEGPGWWRRPDQVAHSRLRDGAEAYRKNDFAAAEQAWRGLPGADAAYNRGNALARGRRYEEAIAAYDEALRRQPGMADAVANRAAVLAAMQRQPPKGPGAGKGDASPKSKPGRPDATTPGDKAGQGDNPSDSREPGSSEARPTPRPAPPSPAPAQATRPASAEAQRAADAAQRQRMQRALDGGTPTDTGKTVPGRPERAESAAERERRQANEAWLRRVPDDPGGLLRAKFRLEHERRQDDSGAP